MGLERRFWVLETRDELATVRAILRRSFPDIYDDLVECFDLVDPLDLVHPGNPGEYEDVVRELLVLLANINGDISRVSKDELNLMVREGLERCFDEPTEPNKVNDLVDKILERHHRLGDRKARRTGGLS